jgi:uncharacterized protein YuzE
MSYIEIEAKVRITLDQEAGAAYIYLVPIEPGGVARTLEVPGTRFRAVNVDTGVASTDHGFSEIMLDLDKDGRLLGIEILNTARLPKPLLEALNAVDKR